MQQDELTELKLPEMPRPGQQPHDGLEFLVGERVVGKPHFELLLQFAHPQQREAFITELDDFLFQQLEDPRTGRPRDRIRVDGLLNRHTGRDLISSLR